MQWRKQIFLKIQEILKYAQSDPAHVCLAAPSGNELQRTLAVDIQDIKTVKAKPYSLIPVGDSNSLGIAGA